MASNYFIRNHNRDRLSNEDCLFRYFIDANIFDLYILVVRRQRVLTAIIRSFVWTKCSKASQCYSVDAIVIQNTL